MSAAWALLVLAAIGHFGSIDAVQPMSDPCFAGAEAARPGPIGQACVDGRGHSGGTTLAIGEADDLGVAATVGAAVRPEATGTGSWQELWRDDFSGNWTDRWPFKWMGAGLERTSAFQSAGETWLRVTYPAGEVGKGFKFKTKMAAQDRLFLEYDLRFAADFDWVKGGKLPGLYGGTGATGGHPADGKTGWSVRFMWHGGGEGSAYVYHPDQPRKYGENFRHQNFWFKKGVVQTLGLEVVMNTPGLRDGIIRAWLDGVLVVEETDIRFRDTPTLQIDGIIFSTFFGGNKSTWAPPKNETADFGSFRTYSAAGRSEDGLKSSNP